MKHFKFTVSVSYLICLSIVFSPISSTAGPLKWLNNEVVPTIKGQRPLKIDPNQVRVSTNGKDIINYSGDSLKVQLGPVSIKTTQLRKRLIQAGAIMAGNTAVLDQVAAEQMNKILDEHLKSGLLQKTSKSMVEVVEPEVNAEKKENREITIYNLSGGKVTYALNEKIYAILDNEGFRHTAPEHYLQLDITLGSKIVIGRWYLTNSSEYFLVRGSGQYEKQLLLCAIKNDSKTPVCYNQNDIIEKKGSEGRTDNAD